MSKYTLEMTLKSDTTFGRGDGVAGLIDAEVEHDEAGLPYLRGRALKGLLTEECANLLFSFQQQQVEETELKKWRDAADFLFGKPGSSLDDDAKMFVGDCKLPDDLHDAIAAAIDDKTNGITVEEVLNSLTTIRRQTAMTEKGAPKENSLRSMRVVIRENTFNSDISFSETPNEIALTLLNFCAKSLRRVGLGRNRGRGKVVVRFLEDGNEVDYFNKLPIAGGQVQ
jgi:hypothetical protein